MANLKRDVIPRTSRSEESAFPVPTADSSLLKQFGITHVRLIVLVLASRAGLNADG
jgi:hypothetical protein